MANYQSTHTGLVIDQAVSAVQTALTNGGIVTNNQLTSTLSSYATTTVVNSKVAALYPVNSVYIMSTNTNPGSFLGGTWSLIDKEFAYTHNDNVDVTKNNTNCTSIENVNVYWQDHSIKVRISKIKPKISLGEDNDKILLTLPPANFGVSAFLYKRFCDFSDNGNTLLTWGLNGDGDLMPTDYISRSGSAVPAGTELSVLDFVIWVPHTLMLDSWCDKFYFKRTA